MKESEGRIGARERIHKGSEAIRDYSQVLAKRVEAEFIFRFSRDYFEVDPGQQLRVVIDVWKDEQSMKDGEEPIKLYSQPFKCPQIGFSP